MKTIFLIAVCLAISATAASAAPAKPILVTVKVPPAGTIQGFLSGKFKETVTCREACKVSTNVLIRAGVAKKLGFSNVKGKLFLIATNKAALKGDTPTKLRFVLTAQARKRLAKATKPVAIFGSVQGVPDSDPTENVSVGWAASLS